MISNFEAAKMLFQDNTYRNRLDLFFIDHEFIPLLIYENYLNAFQDRNSQNDLLRMAEASDSISISDLINQ